MMSFIDNQFHPYQLVIIYASSGCPFKELAKDLEKLLQPEMTTLIVVKDLLTLSTYSSENDWFKVRRNKRRYPKRTGNQRGREICQL